MVDLEVSQNIDQNLQQLLDEGDEIRTAAGDFPFLDTLILSIYTQRYLRAASDGEWRILQQSLSSKHKPNLSTRKQKNLIPGYRILPVSTEFNQSLLPNENVDFTQALAELEAYRLKTSQQNLSILIQQISQARQKYNQAIAKLYQLTNKSKNVYNETSFLDLSDDEWTKTKTLIQESAARIITQGIPEGLPPEILKNAVSLHLQTLEIEAQPLANRLLLAVLQPNLKKDEQQIRKRAEQAAAEVKPVMVVIHKGDVIVRKHETITAFDFDALKKYGKIHHGVDWLRLVQLTIIIIGSVGIFGYIERRTQTRLRQRDHLLILLLTLSAPLLLTLTTSLMVKSIPHTATWSAIGLLLGGFYGWRLSITVIVFLLFILPISLGITKAAVIAGAAGAILGSCMAPRLRSREELALLGVAIALTQGSVYLILKLIGCAISGAAVAAVFPEAIIFGISGLIWSILALGLSPYLEQLFDLVTPSRLAELANPNRPLLKQLATKTPGTFQHTLLVSTLAEAAAKELKCNVELVRAGTLYHDIGKMHDPMGFIENQMGNPNKHDTEIKNPWISAKIIKKHVSEGLVMARKHRLPTAIQAFIPEHQGTMLIAYFYHQAQEKATENPSIKVREADFRYDGPIPQSRETGIVMLADSCEAALRSLKDATPEQALVTINNILRGKWQDNQLLDSGLTREELTRIAEIFVEVWQQFHHKRIAYPKLKVGS
jgi:hypothetical protein